MCVRVSVRFAYVQFVLVYILHLVIRKEGSEEEKVFKTDFFFEAKLKVVLIVKNICLVERK